MNDRKERVYSEEDLCEYTILQKIDELERQLQILKSETGLYETKEDASTSHTNLSNNIASVDNNLQLHIEENIIKFRDIDNAFKHIDKFTPTDVGIKNNKLGLQNGSTWLTNRNAINLEGFTYDKTTNTLKVEGGEAGFNKYKIVKEEGIVNGTAGEHTYTIGEQVGIINHSLTPPSDFNDGLVVLLGTSCYSKNVVSGPVSNLNAIGDKIYYVVSASLKKLDSGKYYLGARAQTINAGTATMNASGDFFTITYAWIYK